MSEIQQASMTEQEARGLTERIRIAQRELAQATASRAALRQKERAHSTEGAVYFIQAKSGGPIKIGTARNPKERLRQLQTGSPVQLQILAAVPGGRALEARLHSRFSYFRLHGEWFEPIPELFDYMRFSQND